MGERFGADRRKDLEEFLPTVSKRGLLKAKAQTVASLEVPGGECALI